MAVPPNLIDTVNKVVRTSRQMLPEIGREPSPEELGKAGAAARKGAEGLGDRQAADPAGEAARGPSLTRPSRTFGRV